MNPALPLAFFLLAFFAAPARAQADRRDVMAAAFQAGRVLMGIDELTSGSDRTSAEGPQAVELAAPQAATYRLLAPVNSHDARLRDQLLESRLPLAPEDVLGSARLVLLGDMLYQPQSRAWLSQSAAALKQAGVTVFGFELLRADQQESLDAYRDGRLSRAALLELLLRDNDGTLRESRRMAIVETLSAVDVANLAGLRVAALGLPREEEETAFRALTGRGKKELSALGRVRYLAALREIKAPLERIHGDDLADRIESVLRADASARLVVLAWSGRLSRYSTAGRLAQSGLAPRTCGFQFPEPNDVNASLNRLGPAVRYSEYWAWVPLDRSSGMDALLLAPAALPQPALR